MSRLPPLAEIACALENDFDLRFTLAAARRPLSPDALSSGERAQLGRLKAARRRRSWLLGRAALKRLLRTLGENADTSRLRFPHPRFSLTHTDDVAIALGTTERSIGGVGIDLELKRSPPPGAQRFFLAPAERLPSPTEADLRRLWTIKEACFKADPRNSATTLRNYVLRDSKAAHGRLLRPRGILFRAFPFRGGCLALAAYLKG